QGGVAQSDVLWLFTVPPAFYHLCGRKTGTWMNGIFYACVLAVVPANMLGFFPTPYGALFMSQVWLALALLIVMAYFAEAAQDRFRATIAAQKEDLRVILGTMPVGVVVLDAESAKVSLANDAASRLLGRAVDESVVASALATDFSLVKEDGAPFANAELPVVRALRKGVASSVAGVFIAKRDGTKRALRMVGAPVRDDQGGVRAAVGVIEDMTKEHEIDQMKNEFVSLASHQLKSPLTSVTWAVETLLDDATGPLNHEQRNVTTQAHEILRGMQTLVSDLLDVSRIETGRKFDLRMTDVDVAALGRDVIRTQAAFAQRSIVTVVDALPSSLMATADADKLREVFMNLVSNAIKYSKHGGTVTVSAFDGPKGTVGIAFKDDGVGIPAASYDRVFQKFYRAPNVAEAIEGTGLGLYIVKAIVEKHGGHVWFESAEGKGTTFFVTLPTADASGATGDV
ncbi:MAG: hypothetical protein RLZZ324_764, partial [Candidatus Parcubacteria bacterium]